MPLPLNESTPSSPPRLAAAPGETRLNANTLAIKSIIVYRDSTVEVTRTLSNIAFKKGKNSLEIYGISTDVDRSSVSLSGPGDDSVVVAAVSCITRLAGAPEELNFTSAATQNHTYALELRNIKSALDAAQWEKANLQTEHGLLDELARVGAVCVVGPDGTTPYGRGDYRQQKNDVSREMQRLDEQVKDLERKLWLLQNTQKGATFSVITAELQAERDCTADLEVAYLIGGANRGWMPYYDLRARTGSSGKPLSDVILNFGAHVTQFTGEHWPDAQLSLRTDKWNTLFDLSVPALEPLSVPPRIPQAPPPLPEDEHYAASTSSWTAHLAVEPPVPDISEDTEDTPSSHEEEPANYVQNAEDEEEPSLTTPELTVATSDATEIASGPSEVAHTEEPPQSVRSLPTPSEGGAANPDDAPETATPTAPDGPPRNLLPPSLVYRVPHKVTIPSDEIAHLVSIASLPLAASLKYICVPLTSPWAYIEATIKNTSTYELPGGPMTIRMDGRLVTKTAMGFLSMGEHFTCALGVDSFIHAVSKVKKTPGEGANKGFKVTRTTTLTNKHDFAVEGVVVREQLPIYAGEGGIAGVIRKPAALVDADETPTVSEGSEQFSPAAPNCKARWSEVNEHGLGGKKQGMYEWICNVPAGGSILLETEWEVR